MAATPRPTVPKRVTIVLVALVVLLLAVSAILAKFPWWFVASIPVLGALIFLAYWYKWKWTGLPEQPGPLGPKTVWDWIQIVIIPVVLLYIAGSIASTQQAISNDAFKMQHAADVQMALDQQREDVLINYEKDISNLLLPQQGIPNEGIVFRAVARARTLTALNVLDGTRKGLIIQFLYEAQLIQARHPIVDLSNADLRHAILNRVFFKWSQPEWNRFKQGQFE